MYFTVSQSDTPTYFFIYRLMVHGDYCNISCDTNERSNHLYSTDNKKLIEGGGQRLKVRVCRPIFVLVYSVQ